MEKSCKFLRASWLHKLGVAALVMASTLTAQAEMFKNPTAGNNNAPAPQRASADCFKANATAELNINNVRTLIWNDGTMWWDHVGTARYEVPKNNDNTAVKRNSLFAGGIWIGGRERTSGQIRILAMTYAQGGQQMYFPGPLDASGQNSRDLCNKWDQIWVLLKTDVQNFVGNFSQGLIRTPSDIPDAIRYWPGFRNPQLAGRPGRPMTAADLNYQTARFVDVDRDGIYDPLKGDYPRLPGHNTDCVADISSGADQLLFFVNNDQSSRKQLNNVTPVPSIGMEVQTEAFAYVAADPRNEMTFYRNKLINRGSVTMDSTYFTQYADPDLGYAFDDYVECDVERGLGICYNGEEIDPTLLGYGENPPSVGIDFFIGPLADPGDGIDNNKNGTVDEPNEKIIMSNFVYYNNSNDPINGEPNSIVDFYNYMRSRWRGTAQGQSRPMTYDLKNGTTAEGQNVPGLGPVRRTNFIFPNTSDQAFCWWDGGSEQNPCPNGSAPQWNETIAGNPPGDRRFLSSAGQFTLEPGASNELTVGVVWARASSGGPRGSFGKLLVADDIAQKLFDNNFAALPAPPEPNVSVTELDQELILTISPAQVIGAVDTNSACRGRGNGGRNLTTETFVARDSSLRAANGDTLYRFQGYIVYQLKDGTVSLTDLNDRSKARIVAQSDVKDNVSRIINQVYDPELDANVPQVFVEGSNQGIQRVVRVNRDLFNTSRTGLVNFKKYYFKVVAYMYNGNPDNQGLNAYLSQQTSKQNALIAVPHKSDPERGGTIIRSSFGQRKDIVRLTGEGNGGNSLDSLPLAEVDSIIRFNRTGSTTTYLGAKSPVAVKVFNPKRVGEGNFRIEVSSRIRMRRNGAYLPQVGDILVSRLDNTGPSTNDTIAIARSVQQTAGRAKVNRVTTTETPDVYDLDVSMFNDDEGGRFTKWVEYYITRNGAVSFSEYRQEATAFFKEGDPTQSALATEYAGADYWKLIDPANNKTYQSEFLISTAQEQLIPELGISVRVTDAANPGELYEVNRTAGLVGGTLVYAQQALGWLVPAQNDYLTAVAPDQRWLVNDFSESPGTVFESIDKNRGFFNLAGGMFAPYAFARAIDGNDRVGPRLSPAFPRPTPTSSTNTILRYNALLNLNQLRSVQIVFTSDSTKWTRCPVLQYEDRRIGGQLRTLTKSTLPSVGINGQPDGSTSNFGNGRPSTGMGWFPGYAYDLERGIRLNMMFTEDNTIGRGDTALANRVDRGAGLFGNDLKYQFSFASRTYPESYGNIKHFVMVANEPYNEGRSLEFSLDSIETRGGVPYAASITRFFDKVMWVGNPIAVIEGARPLATDATVKLQVTRSLRSYPRRGGDTLTNPVYNFSTEGLSTLTNQGDRAKSALDLVRVVPNPYYGYSGYESDRVDNRIIITNLPSRYSVSIFNLSGTLVRHYDNRSTAQANDVINDRTFLEWDLKNDRGLPIASGVYLIYINAPGVGEKTIKWFGAIRPLDLSGLSQN